MVFRKDVGLGRFWPDLKISVSVCDGSLKAHFWDGNFASWRLKFFEVLVSNFETRVLQSVEFTIVASKSQ